MYNLDAVDLFHNSMITIFVMTGPWYVGTLMMEIKLKFYWRPVSCSRRGFPHYIVPRITDSAIVWERLVFFHKLRLEEITTLAYIVFYEFCSVKFYSVKFKTFGVQKLVFAFLIEYFYVKLQFLKLNFMVDHYLLVCFCDSAFGLIWIWLILLFNYFFLNFKISKIFCCYYLKSRYWFKP